MTSISTPGQGLHFNIFVSAISDSLNYILGYIVLPFLVEPKTLRLICDTFWASTHDFSTYCIWEQPKLRCSRICTVWPKYGSRAMHRPKIRPVASFYSSAWAFKGAFVHMRWVPKPCVLANLFMGRSRGGGGGGGGGGAGGPYSPWKSQNIRLLGSLKITELPFNVRPSSALQRNTIKWRFTCRPMMAHL